MMYAPHLGYVVPGGLSDGVIQAVRLKAGRHVLFPSWLMHQVRTYHGDAERISIAFNLTL
jgi:hypothetical protein